MVDIRMRLYIFALVLCLFLTITACSNGTSELDSTSSPSGYPSPKYPTPLQGYPYPAPVQGYPYPAPVQGYPYPAAVNITPTSPYPYPQAQPTESKFFATLGPVPTPGENWGVVTGRLFSDQKPLINATLYLAELSKDNRGTETIASYSPSTSPRVYTDENGNFAFTNISPGRYSLVLYLVVDAVLLNEPGNNNSLILTVQSGKITNLGELHYTDLPKLPF